MSRRESHLHGVLVVDKPGWQDLVPTYPVPLLPSTTVNASETTPEQPRLYTSHDVVQRVRRWSDQRRIGHTGTLDPLASGVLVLCLGQATRLVEYYQGHDKTYYAEITLGTETDSYDALGAVTHAAPVPTLTVTEIEQALCQFEGDIMQVPPVYSALKQGGESLHRKARRGEEVTVQPRPVTIHQLTLTEFSAPDRLCVRVVCSAGTYIRSLAHDLGRALNCAAHLSLLRREVAGAFTLSDSHTLDALEAAANADTFSNLLLPAGVGLQMPQLIVDKEAATRLGQGQKVYLPTVLTDRNQAPLTQPSSEKNTTPLAQIVNEHGQFLGIGRCLKQNTVVTNKEHGDSDMLLWKAEKWLAVE